MSLERAKKLGFASLVFNWVVGVGLHFLKDEEFDRYVDSYRKYLIDYKKARLQEWV